MLRRLYHMRYLIGLLLLVGVVLSGVVYVLLESRAPRAGDPITKDSREYLTDYAGNTVQLSDFRRKVVIAHSWASWCTYCADELKNLGKINEIYGDDIVILAINRAESLADAQAFTDPLNLPPGVRLLLDPTDTFYKQIEGFAMPETIGLDERGELLFHQRGPLRFEDITTHIMNLEADRRDPNSKK
jgi:thiol-disulfide isomerase/thioredoxin